jgi:hypothetical protein
VTTYIEHYANGNVPVDPIIPNKTDYPDPICLPLLDNKYQSIHGVIPINIVTLHGHPPLCRMTFELDWWYQHEYQGWFQIHPTAGTITMNYVELPEKTEEEDEEPNPVAAIVKVSVYQGDSGSPLFTRQVEIRGCHSVSPPTSSPDTWDWHLKVAKPRIVFDEKIRLAVSTTNLEQRVDTVKSIQWSIVDDRHLKFTTAVDQNHFGVDDGRSCMVQALHHATTEDDRAHISALVTFNNESTKTFQTNIEIITDQVEYKANVIEAPYIGASLSTPQLYLITNIGYQMFKNSMLTPRILDSVQVAAVLQNTFSAGMYMSGGGDFPITMNDADSSNLTFTLCDAYSWEMMGSSQPQGIAGLGCDFRGVSGRMIMGERKN